MWGKAFEASARASVPGRGRFATSRSGRGSAGGALADRMTGSRAACVRVLAEGGVGVIEVLGDVVDHFVTEDGIGQQRAAARLGFLGDHEIDRSGLRVVVAAE